MQLIRGFPAPSLRRLAIVPILVLIGGVCWSQNAGAPSADAAIAVRTPLITQPIDEAQLTTLKGNTHPLARPVYDVGSAPATLPMQRMLLVLKRSPEQEYALRTLLDAQQDKASPNYHKWLTPEQFGQQFGPTDDDMQKITAWLQSHGFQVGTTKGRTVLEFSGSASQVKEAFHTSIHKYVVNGEQHWANASDPMIPTALTPAVAGVLTLHNFLSKPHSHLVKQPVMAQIIPGAKPHIYFPPQNGQPAINALGPQDYAVIYDIQTTYASLTGAGVTIGVVGRNSLYNGGSDVGDFRNQIGTGNATFGGGVNIILDGPDPGDAGGGEEAEATLDSTWSGAVAPGATIDFVLSGSTNTTDGIDLSELYIVENNLADIMTESFGSCEYLNTDARLAGINALAEQAAAQGISYFVSTGDNGAEGCDDPNVAPAPASGPPISVNALASTPFNVAVGGTMFNEGSGTYWSTTTGSLETALSYIPEKVWNESSLTAGLWSGSGGASAGNIGDNRITPPGTTGGVPKPSWQFGAGLNIPADGVRDLPDVSLTAALHDPYLLCLEGSCIPNGQGQFFIYFIGGTSAAAPSFAGIMALVDQQMFQSKGTLRQGQPNYVLYKLAANQAADTPPIYPPQCNSTSGPASTCIFNDVTVGNNVVPGESGNSYQAGTGYDLATGLGSVKVANLVNNWDSVTFNPSTTALKLNGVTSSITITHGQSVAVSASVSPTTGTGSVVLLTSAVGAPSTLDLFPLTGGTAGGSTTSLPGSGSAYSVWAHYSGDGTYAPSDSNKIPVTVSAEPSTTTLSLQVTDLNGNPLTSPYPFGSLVSVRADVAGKSGSGIPTGAVTFSDNSGTTPLPTLNPQTNPPVQVPNPSPLNSQGDTIFGDAIISFDAGNHSISGSYPGDPSFQASSSAQPVTFTIQPGFAVVSGLAPVTITAPGLSGTTSIGIVASTGFGAITVTCSKGLPAEATCNAPSITGSGPTTVVTGTITVNTTAPHTVMLAPTQRRYYVAFLLGGLPLAGVVLLAVPRRRRMVSLLGLLVVALFVTLPGCGGGGNGGGGGHQDPGTPAGTYNVTVTATAGSVTQTGTFQLVVQ